MKVLELDISQKIPTIPFEDGYEHYYVLIKNKNHPLGWIYFKKTDDAFISSEEIEELIKQKIGYPMIREMFLQSVNVQQKENLQQEPISVVVCTRNRTAYLKNCLPALLNLDYAEYEIIVVDNAPSNEETYEYVSTLPIKYAREMRPGLDWARNKGIKEAKNSIVAFTDDDALVDKQWLQEISKAFANNEVMAVTGFVAPAELETGAQRLFELGYGGMGHGFKQRVVRSMNLSDTQLIWASNFGVGANMAFRKEVFEKIGEFDIALDVGTPSCGGGDIEMFHRVVAKGFTLVYQPSMLVWHTHRKDYAGLKKQILDNGKGFGCYLISCYQNKTVGGLSILKFLLIDWLYRWILKSLLKRSPKVPRSFTLRELSGMISSPVAYLQTKRRAKQIIRKYNFNAEGAAINPA